MNEVKRTLAGAAAAVALAVGAPAEALEQGDWFGRVGVSHVAPDADSDTTPNVAGGKVDVDNDTQLSFTVGYMLTPNWAVELLGALPFEHDITGEGSLAALGTIGSTKHLPPTLSLQYHFAPRASLRPYAGVGINYTMFFDEEHTGLLAGESLKLDDSWGIALQAGMDIDITRDWFANLDLRWIDIETEATSSAAGTFDVEIDPWVVSVAIGRTF